MMDISEKRSTGTTKINPPPEKLRALKRYNDEVRYFVSTAQFICNNSGQLLTG